MNFYILIFIRTYNDTYNYIDETTLVGAAMGFRQVGLLPFLEIPYAKYLDCASDMFNEAIIANWLSNGNQGNGMLVRLQGFDKVCLYVCMYVMYDVMHVMYVMILYVLFLGSIRRQLPHAQHA